MRGPTQIDAIIQAAETYSLIDLSTLKTLLDITGGADAYLKLIIPQASAIVAEYCNQPLVVETIQSSYWPTRDGWPWVVRGGVAPLQLTRWPIVSVASVVETIAGVPTTLVADTDYVLDPAKGQITRLGANGYPCSWRANPIVVIYVAGYPEIPPSVEFVTSEVVKGIYYARNRDPKLRSEDVTGVYSSQYWFGAGPGNDGALPPDIIAMLDNYHIPVFG